MAQQTAVEWLQELYNSRPTYEEFIMEDEFEQAKEIEEQRIRDAIMHALDEDGHTGDWKIKFVNNYINNLKQTK